MRMSLALSWIVIAACGGADTPDERPGADAGDLSGDGGTTASPTVPAATGTCPALASGDVTFAPAGVPPRRVRLILDAASASPGPLVLYWHATGSAPAEADFALGATAQTLTQAGAVIAVPYSDPDAGQFEWFIVNGSPRLDDFVLADEIVACLVAAGRVDERHVHSMGMSAGALQTTALSFLRSAYVASVATYSGGMPQGFAPTVQDPGNRFAALIFSGGATDAVFGVDFHDASLRYRDTLRDAGHFAALCDHGAGHDIPRDAAPSVARFFLDHGFGVDPSPYAAGLPGSFPAYCQR